MFPAKIASHSHRKSYPHTNFKNTKWRTRIYFCFLSAFRTHCRLLKKLGHIVVYCWYFLGSTRDSAMTSTVPVGYWLRGVFYSRSNKTFDVFYVATNPRSPCASRSSINQRSADAEASSSSQTNTTSGCQPKRRAGDEIAMNKKRSGERFSSTSSSAILSTSRWRSVCKSCVVLQFV